MFVPKTQQEIQSKITGILGDVNVTALQNGISAKITDGVSASRVYSQIFEKNKPHQDLKNRLLEYCKRDTQALLELYKYFMSL